MREGSFYYLLWGWALILASLACYLVIRHYVRIERYEMIQVLCSVIFGGTALSAIIIQSIVFLLASIIAIYLRGDDQLLVFAIAMVLGYLLPGYILRSSKN